MIVRKMTAKMEAFVDAYIACLDATEAYKRAGYAPTSSHKTAKRDASRLLQHPLVQEEIQKRKDARREKSELSVDYVVRKLRRIVEDTEDQNPQHALRGLELLARHLGMLRDKQEISGPDGEAIQIKEQRIAEDVSDFRSRIAGIATRTGTGQVLEFPKPGSAGES